MSSEYDRTTQVKAFSAVQKKLNARFGPLTYTDFFGPKEGGSEIELNGTFTVEDLTFIIFCMKEYEMDFPVIKM